ncbi:hypothetical protein D3C74_161730 [compost metagenome]
MKWVKSAIVLLCLFLFVPSLPSRAAAGSLPVFTKQTDFFASDLYDIAYGNNIYIAVGSDGAIVRSTDAKSWTVIPSGTSTKIHAVAFGNGVFVAVGNNNTILTSADGNIWKKQSLTFSTKSVTNMKEAKKGDFAKNRVQSNTSVIWDGKQFVILTQMDAYTIDTYKKMSSTGYGFVSTSKNGQGWKTTQVAPYLYHASKLKFLNGAYYLFSDYKVMTSKNLVNWSSVEESYIDAAFGSSGFVVAFDRIDASRPRPAVLKASSFQGIKSASPKDLLDWGDSTGASSIDYVHNQYVMSAAGGYLAVSNDGSTWKAINLFDQPGEDAKEADSSVFSLQDINAERMILYKTIWDGHQYIAVSSFGGIYTSTDLKHFEKSTLEKAAPVGTDLYGVGFTEGTYYLYGSNGRFLTSTDAHEWKQTFDVSKYDNVVSVAYHGQDFALVTQEEDWYWKSMKSSYSFTAVRSEGAEPVSKSLSDLDHPIDVKWDGQSFIGRTYFGNKYQLASGSMNWKDITSASPVELKNEPIVVKGHDTTVKYEYSDNGGAALYYLQNGKWIKANFPAWSDYEKAYFKYEDHHTKRGDTLSSVIYGNGEFMAVGAGGTILRSTDGKTWARVKSGSSEYLNSIVWDGKRYIAVGNKGTYLTSAQ